MVLSSVQAIFAVFWPLFAWDPRLRILFLHCSPALFEARLRVCQGWFMVARANLQPAARFAFRVSGKACDAMLLLMHTRNLLIEKIFLKYTR